MDTQHAYLKHMYLNGKHGRHVTTRQGQEAWTGQGQGAGTGQGVKLISIIHSKIAYPKIFWDHDPRSWERKTSNTNAKTIVNLARAYIEIRYGMKYIREEAQQG